MRDYFDLNNLCEIKNLYLFNCIYLVFLGTRKVMALLRSLIIARPFHNRPKVKILLGRTPSNVQCALNHSAKKSP